MHLLWYFARVEILVSVDERALEITCVFSGIVAVKIWKWLISIITVWWAGALSSTILDIRHPPGYQFVSWVWVLTMISPLWQLVDKIGNQSLLKYSPNEILPIITSDALNFVVNTVVIQYCVYYEI